MQLRLSAELWKCQVTESFEDQNQNLVLGEAHELDEYICNMDVMDLFGVRPEKWRYHEPKLCVLY